MTYASDLKDWINRLCEELGLPFSGAAVEELEPDGTRADIKVHDESGSVAFTIEVKRPRFSPHDREVKKQARGYAELNACRYYFTHNVNVAVLWDGITHIEVTEFPVTFVSNLDAYRSRIDEIRHSWEGILVWLAQRISIGATPIPIDESIAAVLNRFIEGILNETSLIPNLVKKIGTSKKFREGFNKWILDVGWDPPENAQVAEDYCDVLARQFLYTFTNKAIFYYVLKRRFPLPDLQIPEDIKSGFFYKQIDLFFKQAVDETGDYETVFDTDFVDALPIPTESINAIIRLIDYVKAVDYSDIEYDVIGKIFENLIRERQRHILGQFFTRGDVADIILGFCVRDPEAVILEPSIGSGTFGVRAYYRLKYLNGHPDHSSLLNHIWGVDIARFPAHLATINLAIRDLASQENYPNIANYDFFDIEGPHSRIEIGFQKTLETWAGGVPQDPSMEVHGLGRERFVREIPPVQAVIGNPPYTRHEELHAQVFGANYKQTLQRVLSNDFPGYDFSDQSGIYAYFFSHGLHFLEENGRLGYVTLRQWLDVSYGENLKQLLLDHTRILCIIESVDEKWFEGAQMLPIITVVERRRQSEEVTGHWAKFIQLKVPLEQIVPPVEKTRDLVAEASRWQKVDEFVRFVEGAHGLSNLEKISSRGAAIRVYEDEKMRILMVRQSDLKPDEKWGRYLGAPTVYFRMLEEAGDLLVPLKEVATPAFGIKTGANPFFCLNNRGNPFTVLEGTDDYELRENGELVFRIEKAFVVPAVTKIKPYRSIAIDRADDLLLSVDSSRKESKAKGLGVHEYIAWGEKPIHRLRGRRKPAGFNESKTCSARKVWFDLGISDRRVPEIVCPSIFQGVFRIFLNRAGVRVTNALHEIHLRNPRYAKALCALLNSTLTALNVEYGGRHIENRDRTISTQVMIYELEELLVPDPRKLDAEIIKSLEDALDTIAEREVYRLYEEIAREDRTRLDEIVFKGILGLSTKEMETIRGEAAKRYRHKVERLQTQPIN